MKKDVDKWAEMENDEGEYKKMKKVLDKWMGMENGK